jgi:outer membrane biosynthesis protein TonB
MIPTPRPSRSTNRRTRLARTCTVATAIVLAGSVATAAANPTVLQAIPAMRIGGTATSIPDTQEPLPKPTTTTTKPAPKPTPTPKPADPPKPGTPTTKPPAANASGVLPASHWEKQFLGTWDREDQSEYRKASTSADSWQYYNLGYAMDATVSMYAATGKTQYLDRALLYANNVISTAKPSKSISTSQYKDEYLSWGSKSHPDGQDGGKEYPLYESYMWRYVTNMLVAMKNDPKVMGNATYKAQYDKVLAFSEKNMFDKWMSRGSDNIYRSHTHMSSHWAMIAFDLAKTSTNAANVKKYETVYKKFDADMRKQLTKTAAGGYTWSAPWGSKSSVQDVSHGNAVMAYIVHSNAYGNTFWTTADMKAFTLTLNKTIWPSAGKTAQSVDGTGSDNGWFNDGFVDLGRFDGAVQKRLEGHKVGQNMQLYASLALNAHLLGKD